MLSLESQERERERRRDGSGEKRGEQVCLLFFSLFSSFPPFSCAVNESHLEMRVLSVGEEAQQLWGAAGYQALPGAWQERERARRHRKLHLASQHHYCRAIDPLQMNSIFRRSLLISNLHCDHICLKNDIVKKMNVLITSPLISPSPGARPFGLAPRSM